MPVFEKPIEIPTSNDIVVGGKYVHATVVLNVWDVPVLKGVLDSQEVSAAEKPLELMIAQTTKSQFRAVSNAKAIQAFHLPGCRIKVVSDIAPEGPSPLSIVVWSVVMSGDLWDVDTKGFPRLS